MKPLNILLISDGKPGHITQSRGLLNQLGKHFAVEYETLEIKPKIKIVNRLLRAFLNKKSPYAEWVFKVFYRYNKAILEKAKPHLILSTGGDTCGVNAVLAQQKQCNNLYLGSLRGHDPKLFSGVISTTALSNVDNCIVLDVAPTLIDNLSLEKAGSDFYNEHKLDRKQVYWAMLIGGDGSGYHYSEEDLKQLIEGMLVLAKSYGIKWLLTTSRRTGLENEKVIQKLLANQDAIAYAVYYNHQPEKIMSAFLGIGKQIFCTEDSTSMISEAVISRKPVFTLYANTQSINQGHFSVVQRFQQDHIIHRVQIDELGHLKPEKIIFNPVDPDKNSDKIYHIAEQALRDL